MKRLKRIQGRKFSTNQVILFALSRTQVHAVKCESYENRANLLFFNDDLGYRRRSRIHRAQKTIYFEGRKLHYQVERAQSNDFLSSLLSPRHRVASSDDFNLTRVLGLEGGIVVVASLQRLCLKLSRSSKMKSFML